MKYLTKKDIYDFFIENQDGITYQKNGRFLVRIAKINETILTITAL